MGLRLIPFLVLTAMLVASAIVGDEKPKAMVVRLHYHEDALFPYVVSDSSFVDADSLEVTQ